MNELLKPLLLKYVVVVFDKCLFARETLQYLSHIVSVASVVPDPTKISAMHMIGPYLQPH